MNVSLVAMRHIPGVWPAVSGFLDPAIKRANGRFLLEDVLKDLMTDQQTLWIAYDETGIHGAATVRVVRYPRRQMARLEAVGGRDMKVWGDELLDLIEEFARVMGCDGIEGFGRKGWERVGKARGYAMSAVGMEKDL